MTLRTRNRMSAWLDLFAMWLVVFARLVNQMLKSCQAHEPIAALCSAVHVHRSIQRHGAERQVALQERLRYILLVYDRFD
ncbi:hypothetical protein [Paraburkholderia ribeironis]